MVELIQTAFFSDASLKAYYRFVSGALTTDSSGESHTLTAISDPVEDIGKFGSGIALDGNDGYSATDHADFKPTGSFTIGVWVKTSGNGNIFASYSKNPNFAGVLLEIVGGKVYAVIGVNTGFTTDDVHFKDVFGLISIADGAWHHVVFVWDTTNVRIYVDGVHDINEAWTTAPAYAATNYVRVGTRNESGTNGTFLTGYIDDLFLLNGTALTAAQITMIYREGSNFFLMF